MGPMFSGKTKSLIMEVCEYSDLGKKCLFINTLKDTRSDSFSTHNSYIKSINLNIIDFIKTSNISDLNVDKYDVIGIDECQFHNDIFNTVNKWLSMNKIIICAGLDGSYNQKPMGEMLNLCSIADSYIKLYAKCIRCLKEKNEFVQAPFTKRIISCDNEIFIGGAESYEACCRVHL